MMKMTIYYQSSALLSVGDLRVLSLLMIIIIIATTMIMHFYSTVIGCANRLYSKSIRRNLTDHSRDQSVRVGNSETDYNEKAN